MKNEGSKAGKWQPRFFSARGEAEGRNGSRLPFACLRPPFFNAKIQNYANLVFSSVFCNVTGKKVKQITFFNFFVTLARQLRKQQQLRKLKYEQLRKQPVFLTVKKT